ncbi:ATP-binding protein [Streptomyces sp. SLBN-115]|uniref:ATP-binding protein n=1 Tax=Streptomyces sp. SLBN-115 TaxID=2768453 RepID=UPI00115115C1|nr:LuxR family transcriptional regulator [Streptomyces sp. SLBN-115]TQJ47351.1 regulatory LuxR family protein [Streptomyces sp. SLBN-115]
MVDSRPQDLFGREKETDCLHEKIGALQNGGGAVLLRGEPGIGKTALLDMAASHASENGVRVLRATGVESEALLPFAGLHQLVYPVRSFAAQLPAARRDALEGALGVRGSTVPDPFPVALSALDLLARAAAHSPVLLVIDDVHRLDRASSDVFALLARRLESEPVLLLAALRDGCPSPLTATGVPDLAVGPLSPEASAALVDVRAPDLTPSTRAVVLREAAGHPLALTELAGTAAGPGSSGPATEPWTPMSRRLQDAFTSRLHTLPPSTRLLLLVAACDDRACLPEILRAASLQGPVRVEASDLAPAIAAGLVEAGDDTVRFRHPLMSSAIRRSTPADRRRAVHAALARYVTAGSDRQTWHEAAAATHPDEQLAVRLDEAAHRARRRGDADESVKALEQAARLSGDTARGGERLLRAAAQAVDAGRHHLVTRLLEAAEPWATAPGQRARLQWIKGSPEDGMRDVSEGAAALTRLARTVLAEGRVDLAASILGSAAQRCFWSEPGPAARHGIVALADELPLSDTDPSLLAIIAHAQPIDCGRRVVSGLRRAAALTAADPGAARLIGGAALLVGEFDLAQGLSRTSAPGLRSEGRLGLAARAWGVQAWSGAQLAQLTSTVPVAEEATRLARDTGQTYLRGLGIATEARIAALQGRHERALELAGEAERIALPVAARPVLATVQLARGLAAMGAGRFHEAYGHLRRMHDPKDPAHQIALRCYALIELTDAAVHCGERDSARSVTAEMTRAASRTSSSGMHSGLAYARAALAEDTDAEGLFRAALDDASCTWPFDRARLQLAYGQWLRRQRRAMDSREQLRAAEDAFDTLGTVPWANRARQELLASGEFSRRREPAARDRLTRQESQVAQLAAEGLTNREIAERLFLSPRTVSTHLHRVFPKLGISSRAALASVFPERGAEYHEASR